MAATNIEAIIGRLMNSPSFKQKVRNASFGNESLARSSEDVNRLAEIFVNELKTEIASDGLSDARGLNEFRIGKPKVVSSDASVVRMSVDIDFANKAALWRPSLDPSSYPGGLKNVARLLNSGMPGGRAKGRVRGVWEGHTDDPIWSRNVFGGYHFIQRAANNFIRNYSSQGVKEINISDEYS